MTAEAETGYWHRLGVSPPKCLVSTKRAMSSLQGRVRTGTGHQAIKVKITGGRHGDTKHPPVGHARRTPLFCSLDLELQKTHGLSPVTRESDSNGGMSQSKRPALLKCIVKGKDGRGIDAECRRLRRMASECNLGTWTRSWDRKGMPGRRRSNPGKVCGPLPRAVAVTTPQLW